MTRKTRWLKIVATLIPGAAAATCAYDVRDAMMTGAMDFVSGTITNTGMAAYPMADFLTRVWNVIFTNVGL